MISRIKTASVIAVSMALLPATFSTSEARIYCNGEYQIINGQPHATPFCADEYLARVARTYGIRVSGRRIRRDLSKKEEICQFIGHDTRISEICSNHRIENDDDDQGRR